MGEGNTPLFRLRNLEKELDWKGELWAKAEYVNPTGSFKDRGSVAEVSEALRLKKSGVVCASTGNMAASLAAYATRAKLPCLVVVPKTTPDAKLRQVLMCGAMLVKIAGVYDDCVLMADRLAKKKDYLLCGDYGTRRKGQRSIGAELAESGVPFDGFVVPVGNGTLGCAVAEGFSTCGNCPLFIGVQATGADSIARAWQNNTSIIRRIKAKSVASAICVGNPLDGKRTLDFVKKTQGSLISVTDSEILGAQKLLSQTEGIYVESSAAATVAALAKLETQIPRVVLILTGSGLKEGGEPYER